MGLVVPSSVRSSDARQVKIPGVSQLAGNDGQVLGVVGGQYGLVTPAAGGGGGGAWAIGMAEVGSTYGSVGTDAESAGRVSNAITYEAPYDPYSGSPGASSVPLSEWINVGTDGDPTHINLAAGWYSIALMVRLVWAAEADAPASFNIYMQGGWDDAHNDNSWFARTQTAIGADSRWGVSQVVSHGPTYINDGDNVHVEIKCAGATFPLAVQSIDGAAYWNITKHS